MLIFVNLVFVDSNRIIKKFLSLTHWSKLKTNNYMQCVLIHEGSNNLYYQII